MKRLLNKISTEEDDEASDEEEIEEIHNLKSTEDCDILQEDLK